MNAYSADIEFIHQLSNSMSSQQNRKFSTQQYWKLEEVKTWWWENWEIETLKMIERGEIQTDAKKCALGLKTIEGLWVQKSTFQLRESSQIFSLILFGTETLVY